MSHIHLHFVFQRLVAPLVLLDLRLQLPPRLTRLHHRCTGKEKHMNYIATAQRRTGSLRVEVALLVVLCLFQQQNLPRVRRWSEAREGE